MSKIKQFWEDDFDHKFWWLNEIKVQANYRQDQDKAGLLAEMYNNSLANLKDFIRDIVDKVESDKLHIKMMVDLEEIRGSFMTPMVKDFHNSPYPVENPKFYNLLNTIYAIFYDKYKIKMEDIGRERHKRFINKEYNGYKFEI